MAARKVHARAEQRQHGPGRLPQHGSVEISRYPGHRGDARGESRDPRIAASVPERPAQREAQGGVVVGECEKLAAGSEHAEVEGARLAAPGFGQRTQGQVAFGGDSPEDLGRLVGRAVIDDEQLPAAPGVFHGLERAELRLELGAAVPCRDEDGDHRAPPGRRNAALRATQSNSTTRRSGSVQTG